ncbi:MAG: FUN14 domain-containing protein [Candidatus Bathyarchaeia archaeon]
MTDVVSPLVFQLGLGAVGGFIVGFALKKLAKLFIVLIGILIVILLYLGTSNIISINFDALWRAVGNWLGGASQMASWLVGLISLLPFVGSFMVGFLLGLKIG